MWRQLQDQIATRQERLHSASEIHKFSNDLDDLLDRIQQKDNSLSLDGVARDAGTVQVLQRQHEVFEHELKPMGNEVSTILNESKRLKEAYKGDTIVLGERSDGPITLIFIPRRNMEINFRAMFPSLSCVYKTLCPVHVACTSSPG
jgi:hypothetical protein